MAQTRYFFFFLENFPVRVQNRCGKESGRTWHCVLGTVDNWQNTAQENSVWFFGTRAFVATCCNMKIKIGKNSKFIKKKHVFQEFNYFEYGYYLRHILLHQTNRDVDWTVRVILHSGLTFSVKIPSRNIFRPESNGPNVKSIATATVGILSSTERSIVQKR